MYEKTRLTYGKLGSAQPNPQLTSPTRISSVNTDPVSTSAPPESPWLYVIITIAKGRKLGHDNRQTRT